MLTYRDGVSDIDIGTLLAFHRAHGKAATVTALRPPARFGALDIQGGQVIRFAEKPITESGWINDGFFVFESRMFGYLEGDHSTLERERASGWSPTASHEGFWQRLDKVREKEALEAMWAGGREPLKKRA